MVRDRLAPRLSQPSRAARVVLTGGASQLTGLPELAARILGRQVRIGRPLGISGLPGRSQRAGFRRRGRASGLSAGGASRTFRTAANAASDDRNWRLHREGRPMAEGKLLMAVKQDLRNGRWRTGRCGGVHNARVWKRQP